MAMLLPNLSRLSIGGDATKDKDDKDDETGLAAIERAASLYKEKRFSQDDSVRAGAFEAGALLVAYVCERILMLRFFDKPAPLSQNVQDALYLIFNAATRVVANTTSVNWFRSNPTADGILDWMDKGIVFRALDPNSERTQRILTRRRSSSNNVCMACGKETLKNAFAFEMFGYSAPDYAAFAPTGWNPRLIAEAPSEYSLPFRRLYNQYTTKKDCLRTDPWVKTFVVGPTCFALCKQRHIARTFFVESMFAATDNLKAFRTEFSYFHPPEEATSYTNSETDESGFAQSVPALLETIHDAERVGADSAKLAKLEPRIEPLYDAAMRTTLVNAIQAERDSPDSGKPRCPAKRARTDASMDTPLF